MDQCCVGVYLPGVYPHRHTRRRMLEKTQCNVYITMPMTELKKCAYCGKEFKVNTTTHRFCSDRCRTRAFRERVRAKAGGDPEVLRRVRRFPLAGADRSAYGSIRHRQQPRQEDKLRQRLIELKRTKPLIINSANAGELLTPPALQFIQLK